MRKITSELIKNVTEFQLIYVYKYIYAHTHTHTHIYIYMQISQKDIFLAIKATMIKGELQLKT
jgi:hypothetical protein